MYNLNNIKKIAVQKKISIRKIANNCDISPEGLHKSIANNKIGIETLYKIADYLKVTISDLIAEKHDFMLPVRITDGNDYILNRFEEVVRENGELKERLRIYELTSRESYSMQNVPSLRVAETPPELKNK